MPGLDTLLDADSESELDVDDEDVVDAIESVQCAEPKCRTMTYQGEEFCPRHRGGGEHDG